MKVSFFMPTLFIRIKLLEFIVGSATLSWLCLLHRGHMTVYDLYNLTIPNVKQIVESIIFGSTLAFLYEVLSYYFIISGISWMFLSSPQWRRLLPISVPVVYVVHSTLYWKYFLMGPGSWPYGILVVALCDCWIATHILRRHVAL